MFRSKFLLVVTLVAVIAFSFGVFAPVQAASTSTNTIVDVALSVNAQSGEFSTLIAALQSANLVHKLDGKGQYTVFAPTDAAFAKLGLNAGNIGSLDQAALTKILLYHVAPGSRYAADVVSASRIRTLSKGFLFPMVMNGAAYIDGKNSEPAKILATDIPASNGVIHVIDTVLLP